MSRGHVTSPAAENARTRYSEGRNCAESVLAALADQEWATTRETVGSAFTRGMGSGCACGALVAGAMALSAYAEAQHLEPVARREYAERLGAQLHERFKERWGSACCRVIRRDHADGSAGATAHCASITEWTAALVAEIVAEQEPSGRRWAARDVMNAANRIALDSLAGTAWGLLASAVVPPAGPVAIPAASLAGVAVGLLVELAGPSQQRLGRLLRASCGITGLAALFVLLTPGRLAELASALAQLTWEQRALSAAVLVVAAAVATAHSAYRYWRYR